MIQHSIQMEVIYSHHVYSDNGWHIFGLCKCRPRRIRIFRLENTPLWKLYIVIVFIPMAYIGFGVICPRLRSRHRPPPMASDIATQNYNLFVNGAKSSVLARRSRTFPYASLPLPLSAHFPKHLPASVPSFSSTSASDIATLLEEDLILSCRGRQEVSYCSSIKV